MKRILFIVTILSILSMAVSVVSGQTIEDLLKLADNISSINYVNNISSLAGITSFGIYGSAGSMTIGSNPLSYIATGVVSVGIYKNLNLNVGISSNSEISISAIFDPNSYQRSQSAFLYQYISDRNKLRMDVINYFFDAMKMKTMINYESDQSTSLQNQTNVALMKSEYAYDLNMINALLNINIDNFSFPALNVPNIPKTFTPYYQYTQPSQNSDLSFGINGSMLQNQSSSFSISVQYSWNQTSQQTVQNVENVQKKKYFDDMNILANFVNLYDSKLNGLLKTYSTVYGNYLQGKATSADVKSISNDISQYGYERDMFCIELLREYYLYEILN
ncbi:hypothetical protein [Athalassotoga sp.]|uniref:hypothetical protein n=1 Tax=Athalassotoga sp. TaxID=2022597 RepID=UPI003D02C439